MIKKKYIRILRNIFLNPKLKKIIGFIWLTVIILNFSFDLIAI